MSAGAALAAAADANLALHFTWVQGRTAGMRASVGEDLVLTDCGMPSDTFNAVCRTRLSPAARGRIREAIDWFEGRPFAWWVGPADEPRGLGALLEAAGLSAVETEAVMALELARLRSVETVSGGLEIRRVTTRRELSDHARISAENSSPPDPLAIRYYERAAPVLLAAECPRRLYVGYAGGRAVATSEMTVAGGVAGLYAISTLTGHRRRGYGTAMTVAALRDAREGGLETAVLQASPEGLGVYERIGFERYGEIAEYKPEAAREAS